MRLDHTFVICAYKEEAHLEDCIKSVLNQKNKTNVLMTTSTPNEYIKNLADKYHLELLVRNDGPSGIKEDWNFAYNSAKTEWVTLAHQDDEYNPDYTVEMEKKISKCPNAIAFVTDYIPIKNDQITKRDINSRIRRLLRKPLKNDCLAGTKFWKKAVLCLGNSICCPAVSYNKSKLGQSFFTSDLNYNIDWDTFLKLSEIKGEFAYVDKPLTYYRVHKEATSAEFIRNHKREKEDRLMFRKFWPEWIVDIIMIFYKKAYDTYN